MLTEDHIRMAQLHISSEETPHHSPYTRWMILALAVAGAIGAGWIVYCAHRALIAWAGAA